MTEPISGDDSVTPSPPEPSDPLDPLVERLAESRGVILFAGAPDTGKTTLIARVVRAAASRGKAVALVDSDIGQSTLGPPATVGMHIFREAPETLRVRRPDALAFIGSTSPFGYFLEMVAGVQQMVARAQNADLALLDTSGLPITVAGLRLKEEKLVRLQPDHLVLLERHRELYPLARLAEALGCCTVHRVAPSPRAHVKPDSLRRDYRRQRFGEYFQGARVRRVESQGKAVRGCAILSGRPVSPQARLRAADILGAAVIRASVLADRIDLVTVKSPSRDGVALLQQRFPRLQVRCHSPGVLNDLMVGLEDASGALLDVGLVQTCDLTTGALSVSTPLTYLDPVRIIRFGGVRVRSDGQERGSVRPGEV